MPEITDVGKSPAVTGSGKPSMISNAEEQSAIDDIGGPSGVLNPDAQCQSFTDTASQLLLQENTDVDKTISADGVDGLFVISSADELLTRDG